MNPFETNFRKSGILLTDLLHLLHEYVKPGQSLLEYDKLVRDYCQKNLCKPAFLGYHGFPGALCTSVNDCLVHGIPDGYIVREGDLLKLDVGIKLNGAYTDAAIAIVVGGSQYSQDAQNLIDITKLSLDRAVGAMKPGVSFFDIGKIISDTVTLSGGTIISSLSGHGVGRKIHDTPYVFNYPEKSAKSTKVRQGMSLAIEPITALGSTDYITDKTNNWNLYTTGGDLGCQREYTILVGENGSEVIAGLV